MSDKWVIEYDPNVVEGEWAAPRLQGWVFGEMHKRNDDRRGQWMAESNEILEGSYDIEDLVALADRKYNIDLRSL